MNNIFILGGTSGIGKALAELLIYKGYNVFIAGRNVDKVEILPYSNKLKLDVTKKECSDILKKFLEKNNIDTFIYSSGVGYVNHNLEEEKELKAVEVNVTGFTRCINVAYHYLSSKNDKTILAAISSVAGIRGLRHAPSYSASKAYIITYLEALRGISYKNKSGVSIVDIRPGFVKTPLIGGESGKYAFFTVTSEKAAKIIYKALEKRRKRIFVPWFWGFIALIIRVLPEFIFRLI